MPESMPLHQLLRSLCREQQLEADVSNMLMGEPRAALYLERVRPAHPPKLVMLFIGGFNAQAVAGMA